MKSPFAILLASVVIVGIIIGIAAILVLGPSDDTTDETVPVASQTDLPTPSSRNEALSRDNTETPIDRPAAEPTETPEQQPIEQDNAPQTATSGGAQVNQRARGAQGGAGGFGGGGNFQAIQEAIAENPELAELFQKAQSGNITQEDQARLRELMQEALADAGIAAPGGGQGGGFGAPPTQGTISTISGSILTIDHNDDSGLSTDVEVSDTTNITVINELTPADLEEGANVAGTVQRGEGGRIFIINLTMLPEQQGGGFRGLFGGPQGGNEATNQSNINGTIAEINDQTISVETTQGTLRLTANEDSNIISTSSGSLSDINEGMAAIAFGGNSDTTPIQPSNLIVGPETLLQQESISGVRGLGGGRQANQGR